MTRISLRDKIGERLRDSRVAIIATILCTVLLNAIDLVAPPLGIPSAVLFIWLVLWTSRIRWSDAGMRRPRRWIATIGIAIVAALFLEVAALFVILPALGWLGVPPPDFARFESIQGSVPILLGFLAVSWTTAGFGEEIVWRGFIMPRVARVLGDGRTAWGVSLILTSVAFGLLHTYQGTAGVVLTTFVGLVLGILYLACGRNLWLPIITHGMTDTVSFLILFTGLWRHLT